MEDKNVVSLMEASTLIGRHPDTLRMHVRSGHLPHKKIKVHGRPKIFFNTDDIFMLQDYLSHSDNMCKCGQSILKAFKYCPNCGEKKI